MPSKTKKPAVLPSAALFEEPSDLEEAFEELKLAILRHKLMRWEKIPREEFLAGLDALKEIALGQPEG